MSPDTYIKERIHNQYKYYSLKARKYKVLHMTFNILVLVLSALIPVFTIMCFGEYQTVIKITIAFLGAMVSILTGILSLCKFHELWVTYRSTAEQLRSLELLYNVGVPPYDGQNALILLATECENILMRTNDSWASFVSKGNSEVQTSS